MTDHLTCTQTIELVEPIAAGDAPVTAAVRAHLETCPRCASALASARRIDAALQAREIPAPPPKFTASVLAAVRRERWRAEQRVDRLFNVAIAAAILLVAGGIAALLNVGEVLSTAASVMQLANAAMKERTIAPGASLETYLAAAAFLASAVLMWWWAERRLSL